MTRIFSESDSQILSECTGFVQVLYKFVNFCKNDYAIYKIDFCTLLPTLAIRRQLLLSLREIQRRSSVR